MNTRICGPGGAYAVRLLVYAPATAGGAAWRCHMVSEAIPVGGTAAGAAGDPDPGEVPEYLVAVPGAVSLRLRACADGLTAHSLQVEAPGPVTVVARVLALPPAPGWLPDEAAYVLFHGDRRAGAALPALHVPFRPAPPPPPETDAVAVDRLAWALGRAVAGANARLALQQGAGGTALVSAVTVRVAVSAFAVSGTGRVLLTLPRRGEEAVQMVEFNLTTVPGAGPPDPDA